MRSAFSSRATGRRIAVRVGLFLVALLGICAILGPVIAPHSVDHVDPSVALQGPGSEHWLGTDEDGRDLLSLVIHGARSAALVGVGTVAISLLLGTLLGSVSGYFGGWWDEVGMRLVEMALAFPGILLAIFIVFLTRDPGLWAVILALSATGWAGYARLVRGQVAVLREMPHVEAARGLGASHGRILWVHVLPGLSGPLAVQATFGLAGAVLAEASLSFLGLGPQGVVSWGALLDQGTVLFLKTPWVATSAGMAIFATVLGVNLLGDALRDSLDPHARGT